MEEAPLPEIITPKETITESFEIKQTERDYKLNLLIINQEITLNLLDQNDLMKEYEKKITFDELKQMHKLFSTFTATGEFVDYLKALIENERIKIIKLDETKLSIELMIEYLFKQNIVKIDFLPKKVNFDLIAKDLYKKISVLNEKYQKIISENETLKKENKSMNEHIKFLIEENTKTNNRLIEIEKIISSFKKGSIESSMDSSIIEKDEFVMINSAIKERMNKDIKKIKKIYQATIDGGETKDFHKKCDNIPNTLVLFKSEGNRRFGGFASECWRNKDGLVIDEYCFLFSLDKKKIYPPKNNNYYQLCLYSYDGPSFAIGNGYCLKIENFREKSLRTYDNKFKDNFDGEMNALSEDGNYSGINAKEYEVFQIKF